MAYDRMKVEVAVPFGETVERVRVALAEQGFGVLTEIDVTATLRAKLGAEMEDYLILGACNPPLAHRALETDRSSGCCCPATSSSAAQATGPSSRCWTRSPWSISPGWRP